MKQGENLASIARQYGTTAEAIADANNISRKIKLKRNALLKIPIPFSSKNLTFEYPDIDDEEELETDNQVADNTSENGADELYGANDQAVDVSNDNSTSSAGNRFTYNVEGKSPIKYVVRKGDSLTKIAETFDTRITDLRIWNDIPYYRRISVGEELIIYVPNEKYNFYKSIANYSPIEQETIKRVADIKENTIEPKRKQITHIVRRGESLASIARRYNVAISDLMAWNNLRSTRLVIGQRIKIYSESVDKNFASTKKSYPDYYVVRPEKP